MKERVKPERIIGFETKQEREVVTMGLESKSLLQGGGLSFSNTLLEERDVFLISVLILPNH